MRKNNYKFIAALAALFIAMTTTGCTFLDVMPRGSHDSDELLSNEDGFKYALTGVYLQLADTTLYGKNTSFYMPEMLCRHWTVNTDETSLINIYSNYNFEDNRGNSLVSDVWSGYYLAIAQCNDILDKLAKTDAHFTTGIRELIEGETYALRGLLHLELLRYWGPVPSEVKANPSARAIPYLKEVTFDTDKLLSRSWKEVTDNILSDLTKAEEILAEHDPMMKYSLDTLNNRYVTNPVSTWESYRQNRMNYAAVLGAKARFYSWIEPSGTDPQAASQAVVYARKVIDLTYEKTGEKQFMLLSENNIPSEGYTLFRECLFALHVQKLQTTIRDPFVSSPPKLTNEKSALDDVYEVNQTFGVSDLRYTKSKMWESKLRESLGVSYMHFQKYGGNTDINDGLGTLTANQVPVMRLPEMYFILMEYLPYGEALESFKTFRIARSMPEAVESTFTESNRMNRLESEYRKEFYGEGQMFFFYKKHSYTSFPWPGFILPHGLADYVLPRPRAQQQFDK